MKHDRVAVIGSGPNGMAAAVVLARAGLDVEVFERNSWLGGGAATRELTLPGFRHDVASAVHPMALVSPFFQAFGLRGRIKLAVPEISFAHPLPDGNHGLGYRDINRAAANLGIDGPAYRAYLQPVIDHLEGITNFTMNSMLGLPHDVVGTAIYGARIAEGGTPLWNKRFKQDVAPAMLTGCAAHTIGQHPRFAMAAAGLMLSATAHAQGWPVPIGGSASIVDAMADDVRAHGGVIHISGEITDIEQLSDFDAVVADVAVPGLLRITGGRLPTSYAKALRRFKAGSGVSKVDFALSQPVPWRDTELGQTPTLHFGGTRADIRASEAAVAAGRIPQKPYVLAVQPSVVDPTRAPEGKAVVWGYTHVPNGRNFDATEAVISAIEKYAPGFRETIIASTATPASAFEAQVSPNFVGGDFTSGAVTLRQMVKRPTISTKPWRTPIEGLYLCSGATSPGPSVHGMGGWHAARTLLEDYNIPVPARLNDIKH